MSTPRIPGRPAEDFSPQMDFAPKSGVATPFRPKADDREATLLRLEALAHLMDSAFLIPGINRRVGLDAIVGLVPIIGDVAGMVIASYVVNEARRLGAPRWLVARMMANVVFDGALGIVPIAGDLFDAAFKANRRNVALLRRHLEKTGGLRPGEIEGTAVRIDG